MAVKSQPSVNVSFAYNPLEETLEYAPTKKSISIGIPKENSFQENRVPLTPQAVGVIVNNGHQVMVEHLAGEQSSYSDHQYSEAGASICYTKEDIYKAEMILKTAPISPEEVELLKPKQIIFSPLHIPSLKKEQIEACLKKQIVGLSIADIKDKAGSYPIVRSMSQIAGISAVQIASQLLTNHNGGMGVLFGGISGVPPAHVVILGAGVVGEYAAKAALGLGAQVSVFDNSVYRLMRLQNNIGQNVYTSVIDPSILNAMLPMADVVIGALKPEKGVVPMVVSESMVERMKKGSIIIDVSIDKGGCIETSKITTHQKPTFVLHDVIHYCVPNMASSVSQTASMAISNILMPLVLSSTNGHGGIHNLLYNMPYLSKAIYAYNGKLTSAVLAEKFSLKYTDLHLISPSNL
jgi:alanine dehydrogenase